MANKSKELDCIKKVIKCKYHIGEFASGIHSILFARKELIDCTGESPDIIINADSEIIGIEHFQADMLFSIKRKKAQSLIGQQSSIGEKLVDKYSDEELLDLEIHNGEAIKPILSIVEDFFEIRSRFKYQDFINNFRKVCEDHNVKSKQYKERLKEKGLEKPETLICLIEIPYLKESVYNISDLKGQRKQRINGIPITRDMLKTIQNMKGFDIVIIFMYNLYNRESEKDYLCYYFIPRNIEIGIRQQGVRPVNSFELVKYPNISIPNEGITVEDDKINFITKYTL